MTVWRVFGGFLIAAVLAVPLGVLMGAYKPVEAFFEPFVSFSRYLPASAFIPLLILWAGIGEAQKLAVIFIGSFFQLVLMVAVSVGNTRRDLVEAAYTLGAQDRGVVARVLLPSSAPEIAETLRMVLGWAWTYVIVAELIGASSGIGHMITDSQALLATDQIIFGILVIGLIGLVTDFAFKAFNRALFPVGATAMKRDLDPAAAGESILSVRDVPGVGKTFAGGTVALQATDLLVQENDFITILGPSGCGKSTLLRMVAGLDTPSGGSIALDGHPGRRAGRRPRHGVPELHAVPLAHRAGQRVLRPAREGHAAGRAARHRAPSSSARWA
jgi:NitT/TauT family transport system permease protein